MTRQQEPIVWPRRVHAHQKQISGFFDLNAWTRHQRSGHIVTQAVMITGDHHDASAGDERAKGGKEALDLVGFSHFGHITGHHDAIDSGGFQGMRKLADPGIEPLASTQVQIRYVRECPCHHSYGYALAIPNECRSGPNLVAVPTIVQREPCMPSKWQDRPASAGERQRFDNEVVVMLSQFVTRTLRNADLGDTFRCSTGCRDVVHRYWAIGRNLAGDRGAFCHSIEPPLRAPQGEDAALPTPG